MKVEVLGKIKKIKGNPKLLNTVIKRITYQKRKKFKETINVFEYRQNFKKQWFKKLLYGR